MNYLQASQDSPYHISVGALVVNNGLMVCHYFKEIRGYKNLTILMRESLELNESLEQALDRGLMEEFGMKATLLTFLGTIVANFVQHGYQVEKTTLYFLMQYQEQNDAWRNAEDPEYGSIIQWQQPDDLIHIMREQGNRISRQDADESIIIKRAIKYLHSM